MGAVEKHVADGGELCLRIGMEGIDGGASTATTATDQADLQHFSRVSMDIARDSERTERGSGCRGTLEESSTGARCFRLTI